LYTRELPYQIETSIANLLKILLELIEIPLLLLYFSLLFLSGHVNFQKVVDPLILELLYIGLFCLLNLINTLLESNLPVFQLED